ncbi:flagellar biosynthetic protein FliQ [Algicella marina]|uniref:Flagellar biosynthetic protein FliQ n=1 Tax=Algicella marina TaxID=2683284 RepID=A0A6P1T132_9RHOB|nr:flagellar biosynthetic protein FliQ [Algicella marina]QHQ36448.1 flagellar biosynthetic protein FliQ [Algicella marina]
MSEGELIDILRQGLWLAVMISAPVLGVALVIGLLIGLFQALTSIQEMTLTFVPKLGAIIVTFWMTMAFSAQLLVVFYKDVLLAAIVR